MSTQKKLTKAVIAGFIMFTIAGCGTNDTSDEGTDSDRTVICPKITIDDSAHYECVSAYLGESDIEARYVYGIFRLRYIGTEPKIFILVDADYMSNGKTVFSDSSYLSGPKNTLISMINSNTNSFLESGDIGYYTFIKDFSESPASLEAITEVRLRIAGDNGTYTAPVGIIESIESPSTSYGTTRMKIKRTDNGTDSIQSRFSIFYFADSSGRLYRWTYPLVMDGSDSNDILSAGDIRTLTAFIGIPPLNTFTFSGCLLEWNVLSPAPPSPALRRIISDNRLTPDERNISIRRAIDAAIAEARNRYSR